MSELSIPEGLDAGELETALGLWLRLASVKDQRAFNRRFSGSEISPVLFAILLVIEANPRCRQADLAIALRMQQPNLSAPLKELGRRGLVVQATDQSDRRAQSLRLSRDGEALLAKLRREHDEMIASYRRRLGDEGYAQLVSLLRAFVEGA